MLAPRPVGYKFQTKEGPSLFLRPRKGDRDIRHPPRYFCCARTRWFRNFKSTRPPLPPEPLSKVHMRYESYRINYILRCFLCFKNVVTIRGIFVKTRGHPNAQILYLEKIYPKSCQNKKHFAKIRGM